MADRDWWPVHEALAWMTINVITTEGLIGRLTQQQAWHRLRAAGADGKVRFRGILHECEEAAKDKLTQVPRIPPEELEGIECLTDTEGEFSLALPFTNWQPLFARPARSWRRVRVSARDVIQQFDQSPPKSKVGRKRSLAPRHLEILRGETFRILDHHGGISEDDPDLNSKAGLERRLRDFADMKQRTFPKGLPARSTLMDHVDRWIDEWEKDRRS